MNDFILKLGLSVIIYWYVPLISAAPILAAAYCYNIEGLWWLSAVNISIGCAACFAKWLLDNPSI